MNVTVEVRGLELFGYHGVNDDERRDGQRFLFDLWFDVPADAAHSDRIDDAVDYRAVVDVVRSVSEERAFQLLEALAAAVADGIAEAFPVTRVVVRVRKPDVRLDLPVEHTAATVRRT